MTPVGSLEVEFTDLRSDKGMLRVCLASAESSFPRCANAAFAVKRNVPATSASVRFDALPPGDYALAVIHDANGNAKLDTTLGIPREGFGFSRNPRIGFGPPSFDAARFPVRPGAEKQQVRMRYLL